MHRPIDILVTSGSKKMMTVLARAVVTKHYRLGSLNYRHVLLTVLEAGRPRSGASMAGIREEQSSYLVDVAVSCVFT